MDEGKYVARTTRFEKSLQHLKVQIEIIESVFGSPCRRATEDEDRKQATDFVCNEMTIAAKVRDKKYYKGQDFGLRSKADRPYLSEWEKMIQGKVELLLYCFETGGEITNWILIDLIPVRRAANNNWKFCEHLPKDFDIDEKDIHIRTVRVQGFDERYGSLILAQGKYPLIAPAGN